MSLFAEIPSIFILSILSVDITSKKVERYLGNRERSNIKVCAPKFLPITFVKVSQKFECNIYSDIDVQSAISVSPEGPIGICQFL